MVARGQRVVLAVYGQPQQAPLDDVQRRHYCALPPARAETDPQDPRRRRLERGQLTRVLAGRRRSSRATKRCWPSAGTGCAGSARTSTSSPRRRPVMTPRASCAPVGVAYRESGRKRPDHHDLRPQPVSDQRRRATVGAPRRSRERVAGRPAALPRGAARGFLRHRPATAEREAAIGLVHGERIPDDCSAEQAPALPRRGDRPLGRAPRRAGRRRAVVPRPGEPAPRRAIARSLPDGGRRVLQLRADRRRPPRRLAVGSLWRDGTRKPSYEAFRKAVALVQSGDIDCSTVPGAGGPIPEPPPTPDAGSPG